MQQPCMTEGSCVKRKKTFRGCWACRERKIKCDGARPSCATCSRVGVACPGYAVRLVWVDGETGQYVPKGRRDIDCESTWAGYPILGSKDVDSLIEAGDTEEPIAGFNPFITLREFEQLPNRSPASPITSLTRKIDILHTDHHLFNHYIHFVAPLMMPVDSVRNPWRTTYPALANSGSQDAPKALYHALLSQSAAHLARVKGANNTMLTLSMNHYAQAISFFRKSLSQPMTNGGKPDFSLFLATILSLVMVEVYNGTNTSWRMHLRAACNYVLSCNNKPWLSSDSAWLMAQSLCLLKVRSDTVVLHPPNSLQHIPKVGGVVNSESRHESEAMAAIIRSVANRSDFGFTAGASGRGITCILETNTLICQLVERRHIQVVDEVEMHINEISQRLQSVDLEPEKDRATDPAVIASKLHLEVFHIGALIYLYRSLSQLPPRQLSSYISRAFVRLAELKLSGSNFALWPVFMIAVEAFEEEHKVLIRDWLQESAIRGMGNRAGVQRLLEEVWRKRTQTANQLGTEEADVIVDWRQILSEMETDILLI